MIIYVPTSDIRADGLTLLWKYSVLEYNISDK